MIMHNTLKVFIGLQLAMGTWYTISYLVAGREDWGILFILFYTYIVHAIFFVVAAVTAWVSREHRKKAWIVMALPVVFFFLPILLRAIRGNERYTYAELGAVVLGLIIAGVAFAFVRPRRTGALLPDGLRRSRVMNWLVLFGLVLTWVVPIALVALVILSGSGSGGGANSGMGVYYLLLAGGVAGAAIGLASLLTMLWSILCLKSLPPGTPRGLNIAQAVVACPGLVLGGATLFLLGRSLA